MGAGRGVKGVQLHPLEFEKLMLYAVIGSYVDVICSFKQNTLQIFARTSGACIKYPKRLLEPQNFAQILPHFDIGAQNMTLGTSTDAPGKCLCTENIRHFLAPLWESLCAPL